MSQAQLAYQLDGKANDIKLKCPAKPNICYPHFCYSEQGQNLLFGTHGFWKAYGNSLVFHISDGLPCIRLDLSSNQCSQKIFSFHEKSDIPISDLLDN